MPNGLLRGAVFFGLLIASALHVFAADDQVFVEGDSFATPAIKLDEHVSIQFSIRNLTKAEQQGVGLVADAAEVTIVDARPEEDRTHKTFDFMRVGRHCGDGKLQGNAGQGFDGGCAKFHTPKVQRGSQFDIYIYTTSSFLGGDLADANPKGSDGNPQLIWGPRGIEFERKEPTFNGGKQYYDFTPDQCALLDKFVKKIARANAIARGE